MRAKVSTILVIIILGGFAQKVFSYPPSVGILGNAKSCMSCHVNNGPWSDEDKTIIDILDKETMKSLRQVERYLPSRSKTRRAKNCSYSYWANKR